MIQINAHIQIRANSHCAWEILVKESSQNINKICSNAKEFFIYMNTLDKLYKHNASVQWSIDSNIDDECFEKIQNEIKSYIKNKS